MNNEDVAKAMGWSNKPSSQSSFHTNYWWDENDHYVGHHTPNFLHDPAQIPVLVEWLAKNREWVNIYTTGEDVQVDVAWEDEDVYHGQSINEALCKAVLEVGS